MKSEITYTDVKDTKAPMVDKIRSMQPEHEMTPKELLSAVREEFDKAAESHNKIESNVDDNNLSPEHKECMTTSAERKEFASHSDGEWTGEPGDSKFVPEKPEARDALSKYDQSGIDYSDGEPDFSKVSESTVQIKNMTSNRADNFRKADEECAKQWNEQGKDGRNDWTARDIKEWRHDNRFSWHERLDMKTMDLVQRDIHDECKHFGGVAECKRHETLSGGGFDE